MMGPKKRPRKYSQPDGIGRTYLLENFSCLPSSVDEFLNGHILMLYQTKCECSRKETVKKLMDFVIVQISTISDELPDETLSIVERHIYNKVKNLVSDRISKIQSLSTPNNFNRYTTICNERFLMVPPTTGCKGTGKRYNV